MMWVYHFSRLIPLGERQNWTLGKNGGKKRSLSLPFKGLSKRPFRTKGNASGDRHRPIKECQGSDCIWRVTLGPILRTLTTASSQSQRPENVTGVKGGGSPVHSHPSALTDQLRACVQIKRGEFECLASWEIKGQRVY